MIWQKLKFLHEHKAFKKTYILSYLWFYSYVLVQQWDECAYQLKVTQIKQRW